MSRKKAPLYYLRQASAKVPRPLKVKIILLIAVAFFATAVGGGYAIAKSVSTDLPYIIKLKDYKPPLGTQVFSEDDHLIGRIKADKGIFVPLAQIPDNLKKAIVAVEDARFYQHEGVDFQGILRAVFKDVLSASLKEGGSTITQQLAKVMFLTPEKSFTRKLKEVVLARRLEKELSKDDILELYLNKVYFGHGAYGAEMAARTYFGKHVGDLGLPECAMIAGLVRSPGRYSPYNDPERAKQRRAVVLVRMVDEKFITQGRADEAAKQKMTLDNMQAREDVAPHLIEQIRIYLEDKYGADKVYLEGMKVKTTLNYSLQLAAKRAVERGVLEHAKRQALASAAKTAKGKGKPPAQPEVVTAGPTVQCALVAIDPTTGDVKAIVGGPDFQKNEFNHAILAKRQPGSAFKPLVYAAAMEAGFTPASVISDEEHSYGRWKPENYDRAYTGPMRLRDALTYSKNVIAVELLQQVGLENVLGLAKKLGLSGPFANDLTLALGSCSVTPVELTAAYCAFANGGYSVKPRTVVSISDSRGRVLERNYNEMDMALSAESAYQVTSMLEDVVRRGTARRAASLGVPVAGKTGTTNNYIDAWFVGFTPSIVAGVWVGYDDQKTIGRGEAGARAALPIWTEFMRTAASVYPSGDFPVPDGIEFVSIDPETGLLIGREGLKECFKTGTAPKEYAPSTGVKKEPVTPEKEILDNLIYRD